MVEYQIEATVARNPYLFFFQPDIFGTRSTFHGSSSARWMIRAPSSTHKTRWQQLPPFSKLLVFKVASLWVRLRFAFFKILFWGVKNFEGFLWVMNNFWRRGQERGGHWAFCPQGGVFSCGFSWWWGVWNMPVRIEVVAENGNSKNRM